MAINRKGRYPHFVAGLELRFQVGDREDHLHPTWIPGSDDLKPVGVRVEVRLAQLMLLRGIEQQPARMIAAAGE